MLFNYFKTGFRLLIRQKTYALLNLVGLTLGITVFVFIYLYIQSELSYDKSWKNYKHLYRVTQQYAVESKGENIAITPFLLAEKLKDNFPEVKRTTRLFFTDPSDKNAVTTVKYDSKVYDVQDITIGDKNVFKIFDYNFLEGNPDSALVKPRSLVLSYETSHRIFGDTRALDKKVKTGLREYTVTGVFDKRGRPSHLNFDGVISVNSFDSASLNQLNTNWFWMNCYTYVLLDDTVSIHSFTQRVNKFVEKELASYVKKENLKISGHIHLNFEPISTVHFSTGKLYDSNTNVKKSYLYIFGFIALFILLTASINYINMATARSIQRAKEIGVRKVLGASRKQLMWQYISESFLLTITAFLIALSLVEILMPQFNSLVGKNLTLVGSLFTGSGLFFGLGLIILMLLLSVISGSLPAFVISSFQPVNVLKGNTFFLSTNQQKEFLAGNLRKWLVTVQYIVAIGMIVSTSIIYSQIHFIKNQNLGFDKNNVLIINTPSDTTFKLRAKVFMKTLQSSDAIKMVIGTANFPGYTSGKSMFTVGDSANHKTFALSNFIIGPGFFQLLHIPLVQGRFFSENAKDDTTRNYIINEAAAKFLNIKAPLNVMLNSDFSEKGRIIGLVKNFNFSSLHEPVEPLVFMLRPRFIRYIIVRIKPHKKQEALSFIQNMWNKFNKGYGMHYTFLNKKLESLYHSEENLLSLFIYFTFFLLFISVLGLYGLTSFLLEQRTKEIGIRKILGGSESGIALMIAGNYLKLVLIAGLITSPIVYLLMNKWIKSFAYHIDINIWYFVFGIALILLIAMVIVLLRSIKSIGQSPATSLKHE